MPIPCRLLTQASSAFTSHKGREWHLVSICIHFIVYLLNVNFCSITCMFKSFTIFLSGACGFPYQLYKCFTFYGYKSGSPPPSRGRLGTRLHSKRWIASETETNLISHLWKKCQSLGAKKVGDHCYKLLIVKLQILYSKFNS